MTIYIVFLFHRNNQIKNQMMNKKKFDFLMKMLNDQNFFFFW